MVAPGAKPSVRVWTKTSVTVVSHSSQCSPLIRVVPLGPKLSISVEVTSSVMVLSLVQDVVKAVSLGRTAELLPVPTIVVLSEASGRCQLLRGQLDGRVNPRLIHWARSTTLAARGFAKTAAEVRGRARLRLSHGRAWGNNMMRVLQRLSRATRGWERALFKPGYYRQNGANLDVLVYKTTNE